MLLPTVESVKSFAAVGSSVLVHSFGCWYHGTVVSFGRTRIKVTFWTRGGISAGGKPRTKSFEPGYVVPVGTYAEGRRGEPEPKSAQGCRAALWRITYGIAKAKQPGAKAFNLEAAVEEAKLAGCEQHEIDDAQTELVVTAMEVTL